MSDYAQRLSLQTILALDAATCAAMGLLLISAPAAMASLTAISELLLFLVGLSLLPIAAFMVVFARAATVPAWAIHLVVAGNVLWVLGSLFLPLIGMITPSGLGWLFLLTQAAVVALFAILERAAGRHGPAVA